VRREKRGGRTRGAHARARARLRPPRPHPSSL
jgi:hypothetical protein